MTTLVLLPIESLNVGAYAPNCYDHIGDWLEAQGIEIHDIELFREVSPSILTPSTYSRVWDEFVLIEFKTEHDAMLFKLAWA